MYKGFHKISPMILVLFLQGSEHAQECPIKVLNGVALGMVGRSTHLLCSNQGTKLLNSVGFKVPSLITMKATGKPTVDKKVLPECFGDCFGLLLLCWHCYGELSEMVSDDQDVPGVAAVRFEGQIM